MNTPIADFIEQYDASRSVRLHMPGHKGVGAIERQDLTEIPGADSLYEASGIIRESEQNASALFGCPTYYSTEGSSHAIRAMLHLTALYASSHGERATVLAARNAHKVFIGAAALLGIEVRWLPSVSGSYLSSPVDPDVLPSLLEQERPTALYLTSPDYLGGCEDIAAVSAICRRMGVLLLVDNAHGAYLRFLSPSRHPIDLGAHLCADSAHKTLPVLTGGAYLHLSPDAPAVMHECVKVALSLYGSTSPSYLTLASLDRANAILDADYSAQLSALTCKVDSLKRAVASMGCSLWGDEPLKLTVAPKSFGYTGTDFSDALAKEGIVCEFADADFAVMMFSTSHTDEDLDRIGHAITSLPPRPPITEAPPSPGVPERRMTPSEALLAPSEWIATEKAQGRVLGAVTVGCPPAVPILVMGEVIDKAAIAAFQYYKIDKLLVIKE